MKGKVGKGRHGGFAERSLLTCHMRSVKLSKRVEQFSKDVSDVLSESQFVLNSEVVKLRVARAPQAMGLALQLTRSCTKGNRYKRSLSWSQFLQAAFGKIHRNAPLALHLGVAKSTVRHMQIMVSAAYMNHQANFLAKLAQWSLADSPLLVIKHFKWDETQLQCSMNADKSGRVRSSWQVLVCRMRLVVVWPSGTNLVLRVVMPPVTLLATGAEHQYYALMHHPAYKCINSLVGLLRRSALVNIDIAETDGASSNLRLLAHLSQKAKLSVFGPPGSRHPVLFAHCRCMNHAVQLNNAALLGLIGSNLLNKIYGMCVFIRNLGYWLRMRQAARAWLDRQLVFRQQVTASDVSSHIQPNPALHELVSYLRFWKKLDRDCRSPEDERRETAQDDGASAFDRAAAAFLEMFNGPVLGPPCHICSSLDVSVGQRHCSHRDEAARKCAEAMVDLFLTSMPAVPAPSKWSKLFGPLDFVLSGSIVHDWLQEIFAEAFGEMSFQEFDTTPADVDPRLVESLAFHAVNGRRLQSAREFLRDRHAEWGISLACVAMEANRMLTWHWLSCLGKSLTPGERPALYSMLDPRESILISLMQHYSSLVCTTDGLGRLCLLWMPLGYDSFDRFCRSEPGLVREIRRVLLFACAWQYRRHYEYISSDMFAIACVADPDACPRMVGSFLEGWKRKRVCCMPGGLPRALKLRQVTCEELQSSSWKATLHWYASCIQWSIADVEVKHASNRQNTDCGFSTVASKFSNSEALLNSRQTTKAAKVATGALSLAGGRDVVIQDKRVKKAKGKSPFEIFRAHWICQQQLTSSTFNPCVRSSWDEVRKAWQLLSAEQQQNFKALSDASKQAALQARRQVSALPDRPPRESALVVAAAQEVSHLPHAGAGAVVPSFLGVLPLESALTARNACELESKIKAVTNGSDGRKKLCYHGFPVSEGALEAIACCQRRQGISSAAAVAKFDCEMERLARPPDGDEFPKKVQYESCCGHLCIALHCNLIKAFVQIVKGHGQPLDAVRADIVCSFEVFDTSKRKLVREFAFVTAVSARSGVHKPEQVFVFADEVGRENLAVEGERDRFTGLLLDLRTLPYVQSHQEYLPASSTTARVGRLHMLSSDAFAHHLLSAFDEVGLTSFEVVINKLSFHDRTPRRVCISGCSPGFTRVLVRADGTDGEYGDGDDGDGKSDAPENAPADPLGQDFDYLSLLDQEVAEDILDDPELHAILGSGEIDALRKLPDRHRTSISIGIFVFIFYGTQIIKQEGDGGIIEAVYGGGEGSTAYCVVDRVQGGSRYTLGEIKLLVKSDTGEDQNMVARRSGKAHVHSSCRTCRRSFDSTKNPMVKNPAADDLLKRRCVGAAQCRPCYSFMERDTRFQGMSHSQRLTYLDDDSNFEQYMEDLTKWEAGRRDGNIRLKAKSKDGGDRAEALQSSSITTKQVMGYFWPLSLLKEHDKPLPKRCQHITHQGRKIKGITLKEFAVGCIEVSSESSKTARRVHVMAHDDSDESGDADETFGAMQKSLQMSATTAESGEIQLKQAKVDSDDELAAILFGETVIGGGNSKSSKGDDEHVSPAKKKPRKRHTTTNPGDTGESATANTPATSALPLSLSSLPALTAFNKESRRKGHDSRTSRELEKTEAIILQCKQLKLAFEDPEQVLELSLQKVKSLDDRVDSRLSDELTAMCQEAIRATGPLGRATMAWEGLKEAKEFLNYAGEFVEALHDAEAAPTTLSTRAMALAKESKVTLPPNVSVLVCRKRAEELVMKKQWDDICKFLDPTFKADYPDGIASLMPETDTTLTADLLEFQAGCLQGCVSNLFMRPIPGKTEEEKNQQLQDGIEDIVSFLNAVKQSPVSDALTAAGKASLVDELAKLLLLAEAASKVKGPSYDMELFPATTCDQLDTTKNSFLKIKTSTWYPSLAMFPVGMEVCLRIGNVVQQVRADAVLAADMEAAAQYANTLKPWKVESVLKDSQEVSIPAVSKLADMVGKWLLVQEKGSQSLQAMPAVHERMELVKSKVAELHSVLQEVMVLKYKNTFEKMETDITKLVKGGTQEEMTSLTSSIATSFAQMSSFQPLNKELDGIVQTVAKYATSLHAAFPQMTDVITKKNINEEMLANQSLADVFAIFFDVRANEVMLRTLPYFKSCFSLLQEGTTRSICGWLAQTSATFDAFVEQLLQAEVNADASLSANVVGDTTSLSEAAAAETQDCKQTLNFGFVFHAYVKHIGKEFVDIPIAVHDGQEARSRRVHAVFPCTAGALLTVAKMVAFFKHCMTATCKLLPFNDILSKFATTADKKNFIWENNRSSKLQCIRSVLPKFHKAVLDFETMQSASAEIVGEMTGIDEYYKQLQNIVKTHLAEVIGSFGQEVADVQLSLASLYQDVASKHSLDMFKQEVLDKKIVEALCLDPSMRQIALSSSKTERFFVDLIGFLQDVQGLPTPSWVSESSKALLSGVVADAKKLLAQDSGVSCSETGAMITMAELRALQSNMTLAQALCRDLQPGETRVGLVSRCLGAFQKKSIKCEPSLVKKATAITGK
ncbi:unnamed protein product [Symbiodinium necroappetens]|uniref:Uncharacterized protein n=1 Tax=Symbiodinium necroappetens TaxID=1628268 RepID=A0A812ZUY4_9DINO|nr:unnamed protein product [Symbiodinium necroappetens]